MIEVIVYQEVVKRYEEIVATERFETEEEMKLYCENFVKDGMKVEINQMKENGK